MLYAENFDFRRVKSLDNIVFKLVVLSWMFSGAAVLCVPNCSDKNEVEAFFTSDEYHAMYTTFSDAINKEVSDMKHSSEYLNDSFMTLDQLLPANKSTYLPRRPPQICGRQANTNFHISLLSLDSVDEAAMTYVLDLWLSLCWFDDRLRYPPSASDYRYLDVQWIKSDLWIPDVIFRNARKVKFHDVIIPNHYLVMRRNKALTWISKLTLTLTCPMNLEWYPHDTQKCSLEMESMKERYTDLSFTWDKYLPVSLNKNISTPQYFSNEEPEVLECTSPYYSGKYPCVSVIFKLKRRIGFHLIHFYLPSAMVVAISWVTFWIKVRDLTARFGLGLTCLLTLVTLNSASQEELPPVSYYKAIDVWMMTCATFVFVSILVFGVVNYLVGNFPETEDEGGLKVGRVHIKVTNSKVQDFARNIDRICRVLFPIIFLVFNIWYWLKYSSPPVATLRT